MQGLRDLRVVDLSSEIAGPYCTKLFADAGAQVIRVEPPEGDPLRRYSATGADLGGRDAPLFRFLNASKRSLVGGPGDASVEDLLSGADLLVEDLGPGAALDRGALLGRHRGLVLLSISPYGLEGPWAARAATEFTVQAESGSIAVRGLPGREPYQAGGRTTEWISGATAAAAALAAVRRARETGHGEHVDFSLQEMMAMASTVYMDTLWGLLGRPPVAGSCQNIETPSIEPTVDGYVGFNTNTAQQLSDFLLLIGQPELRESHEFDGVAQRLARLDEWQALVHAYTRSHSTAEIVQEASLLRIPVAPVCNGATVLEHEHLRARGIFSEDPSGGFQRPCPPYRLDGERPPAPRPAPALGEAQGRIAPRQAVRPEPTGAAPLPLAGLRVVDATTWWAGPAATQLLACLGADVIHLESVQKPDGARMVGGMFASGRERWWECSQFFLPSNANKRGLTLDLANPRGLELAKRLVAGADVLVENFSPRVMEGFGLDWPAVQALNPRCLYVRMPAFGLDGPWRDHVGFAQTMEQMSGLAWLTGHEDDQPRIQRGPCDPLAGVHAAFAILVGLAERDRSGRGHFIECAMVEAALNAAAEQVVEYTASGRVMERRGNRAFDAAPQGLYPCRGHDPIASPRWLALSVRSDAQWAALLDWLGDPPWARELRGADRATREGMHEKVDQQLRTLFADRDLDACVEGLLAAGVPAAALADPRALSEHPQLVHRGFFEEIDHAVVGRQRIMTVPFRYASVERWIRRAPPTLGEHNREILLELGLAAGEIDALHDAGVVGTRPARL